MEDFSWEEIDPVLCSLGGIGEDGVKKTTLGKEATNYGINIRDCEPQKSKKGF